MPHDNARETLSAKLSAEAAAGWKNFCHANGVSLTALLEVVGLQLATETEPSDDPDRLRKIEAARRVDMERRARK